MSKSHFRSPRGFQQGQYSSRQETREERQANRVSRHESDAAILQMMLEAELDTIRNSDQQAAE